MTTIQRAVLLILFVAAVGIFIGLDSMVFADISSSPFTSTPKDQGLRTKDQLPNPNQSTPSPITNHQSPIPSPQSPTPTPQILPTHRPTITDTPAPTSTPTPILPPSAKI